MKIKAEIIQPSVGDTVQRASTFRVYGTAWAGESEVSTVELSVDGGTAWTPVQLLDTPCRYCWVRWQYEWNTPTEPGPVVLLARASDKNGAAQPSEHTPDERHYAVHHFFPILVTVE